MSQKQKTVEKQDKNQEKTQVQDLIDVDELTQLCEDININIKKHESTTHYNV